MDPVQDISLACLTVVLVICTAIWGYFFNSLPRREHPVRWGIALTIETVVLVVFPIGVMLADLTSTDTIWLSLVCVLLAVQIGAQSWGALRPRPPLPEPVGTSRVAQKRAPDWGGTLARASGLVVSVVLLILGFTLVRRPKQDTLTFYNSTDTTLRIFAGDVAHHRCGNDPVCGGKPAHPDPVPPYGEASIRLPHSLFIDVTTVDPATGEALCGGTTASWDGRVTIGLAGPPGHETPCPE